MVPKPLGPAPDRASLHEAALRHLSKFSTTQAGLVRVLDRRVQRWIRAAALEGVEVAAIEARAREAVRDVAHGLVQSGVVDDAAFAASRAARLVRSGRSRRAIAAQLAAKGVEAGLAQQALPSPEQDLPAALAFARRRRIGPFRIGAGLDLRPRDLGALARAGFSRDVAERALDTDRDEAEALVTALKRG